MVDANSDPALAALPILCSRAGKPQDGWEATPIVGWEAERPVSVFKLTRPGSPPLILKHEPRLGHEFEHRMAEHRAAYDAFIPQADLGIPALLATDAKTYSCLMEYVPGVTLKEAVQHQPLAVQAELLAQAGRWLSAFHASRPGKPRIFQPRFGLEALSKSIQKLDSGELSLPEPELYRRAVETFRRWSNNWEGQLTVAAAQHGDLHLRNILLDRNYTAGIDFTGGHDAPVGHDIARLLVEYASLFAPLDEVPMGSVLPSEALHGFFSGYKLTRPGDPSVKMMLRMRILIDWQMFPSDPDEISPAKAQRLVGLIQLAHRAFKL